jgi:peptidoglycan/LPS O-acetylase OafA/YrhL
MRAWGCAGLGVAMSVRDKVARSEVYRPDIDGLRAIAVIAVILVHAGSHLQGGFLGADVFFVISGYLIHKDLSFRFQAGTFSARNFYGRRMRRTLPALYLATLVSLIVAGFILLPGEFDALARSAMATGLSVSNILFLTEAGYFDHSAITKPLLHTWSLGVEEQFYLVAPLVSYGLARIGPKSRRVAYIGFILLGLAFCVTLQAISASAAFYLMPVRLWEFLIGCAIADRVVPAVSRRWSAELITAVSLLSLIASMVLVSSASPHPGLPTAIPCVATAAIIHTGGSCRSLVGRVLETRVFVFLGLISYSLYLWHWPLIVFVSYLDLPLTAGLQILLGILLVTVAFLTWKYVERPFRDPASPLRRRALVLLPSGLAAVLGCSLAIVVARGLPERFPETIAHVSSYYDYESRREFREGTCFLTSKSGGFRSFNEDACLKKSHVRPNYLLIGDSEAAHLWIGLSTALPEVNFLQATASGCKPVIGTAGETYCSDLINHVLLNFLPHAAVDGVIFAGAWKTDDASLLEVTIEHCRKFVPKVIVLGRVPSYDMPLPTLIGRSLIENRPEMVREHLVLYAPVVDHMFEKSLHDATYVSLFRLLCPDGACRLYGPNGAPLQFDGSHLTTEGSVLTAMLLKRANLFDAADSSGASSK